MELWFIDNRTSGNTASYSDATVSSFLTFSALTVSSAMADMILSRLKRFTNSLLERGDHRENGADDQGKHEGNGRRRPDHRSRHVMAMTNGRLGQQGLHGSPGLCGQCRVAPLTLVHRAAFERAGTA
ncbi:hypothetical protein [Modicisalibacter coralii]|uniref:hypothetical protein n=1 Tax=Modicisalibacter coralii TaxID=2304602 RepID=UPI00100BAF9A|nr:hypothetical protein [Halomonas coralii]